MRTARFAQHVSRWLDISWALLGARTDADGGFARLIVRCSGGAAVLGVRGHGQATGRPWVALHHHAHGAGDAAAGGW